MSLEKITLQIIPRLLTTKEAALYIGMCEDMLIKFANKGWITPFYFPGCRSKRWDKIDLNVMINKVKKGIISNV